MTDQPEQTPEQGRDETPESQRVVVVTPDGMGVAQPQADGEDPDGNPHNPADQVEQPAKVMRIGSMIKQLLEEVRGAPLDDAGRKRLADIHRRSLGELKEGLSDDLVEELERLALPFTEGTPSDAELRIAQAQLVGWLEGLFHGIQTAFVAQQMAAQAQLQAMQRGLPMGRAGQGGPGAPTGQPGMPGMPTGRPADDSSGPTGQYL